MMMMTTTTMMMRMMTEKPLKPIDVAGFSAFDPPGTFAKFSRVVGGFPYQTAERNPRENIQTIQWRWRLDIADFCPLSWWNVS